MADDAPETPTPEAPDTPAAAPAAAPAAPNYDERFQAIDSRLAQVTDALQAVLGRSQQQPQGGAGPTDISAEDRAYWRSRGYSDADIEHNARIVNDFQLPTLRRAASEIVGHLASTRDEVEVLKAGRNSKEYPDWETVGEKALELKQNAAKGGQFLTIKQAYDAAVALDPEAVATARQAKKQRSAAADLSAQHLSHGGGRASGSKTPQSADDLRAMSREERKKLYDSIPDSVQ